MVAAAASWGQSTVEIRSDDFKGGRRYQIFTRNVRFEQDNTQVFCDSAVRFNDNRVEAYGRVRVVNKADSVTIRAKQLYYDPVSRRSRMRQDVVYRGPDFTLFTDNLDYNMATRKAQYFNGGRIVDEQMKLESVFGDFNPANDVMIFRTRVVLNDPQGIVKSDYLRYNTKEGMAYFEGPTQIIGKDNNVINAKDGAQYDTETRQFFGTETRIEDPEYVITGDQSSFIEGFRKIVGHVNLFSKSDSVTVLGREALYQEAKGLTQIYGNPKLIMPFGNDTLWLSADTLVSYQGRGNGDRKLIAYNNVRIFKNDLQGVADSLIYNFTDSTIYFYSNPAIWSEETQITGDSIQLLLGKGQVRKMYTYQNSFVISQVNARRYNQIKGRQMETDFRDNKITRLNVQGNGESVYFQVEADSMVSGMNRMICSNMLLTFENNKISRIRFYQSPEASFVPVQEISEEKAKLEGFTWRDWQRPTREAIELGLEPPKAPTPEALRPEGAPQPPNEGPAAGVPGTPEEEGKP